MNEILLKKQERKTVRFIGSGILLFLLISLYPFYNFPLYNRSYFLISHTMLEFFSIFVSFSIFMQAWLTYSHNQERSRFLIGILFLCVGTFDLVHTLSFKGMPFFDERYAVARATWLWIIARITEAIGLSIFLFRDFSQNYFLRSKFKVLVATFLYMTTGFYIVFAFVSDLPLLVEDGKGVTPLKFALEYVISLFHLGNVMLLLLYYKKKQKSDLLVIITGIFFILVGELVFTLYKKVDDLENLLGHVYKCFGYFFLLKGIFYPQLQQVYEEKEEVQMRWQETAEKLRENEQKMPILVMQAQEEERKRVSRDLHDGVGQALYSSIVMVKMAKRSVEDQSTKEVLQEMESVIDGAMTEVREIAAQLRPSALDDLGLIPALRSYISRCRDTYHIRIELHIEGIRGRFSPDVETELYRICQEALTNAVKYSGTEAIDIMLAHTENHIHMKIQDYGSGFDMEGNCEKKGGGIGMFSMQERAALLYGKVRIESSKGNGTVVHVYVPVGEHTYIAAVDHEIRKAKGG